MNIHVLDDYQDTIRTLGAGALEAALPADRPGMAAVDVYEEEPVLRATLPSSPWTRW